MVSRKPGVGGARQVLETKRASRSHRPRGRGDGYLGIPG
jgi:hypothetical protein